MINAEDIIKLLKSKDINFFSGVPDSVLKNLSNILPDNKKHIISVNEGSAISLAVGYHLSTNKIACVYLQNSGLGNAINPLISIAHKQVYSVPLVLIIGWRGSPKTLDEPQHKAKGKITLEFLKLLNIKFCILRKKNDLIKFKNLIEDSKKKKA